MGFSNAKCWRFIFASMKGRGKGQSYLSLFVLLDNVQGVPRTWEMPRRLTFQKIPESGSSRPSLKAVWRQISKSGAYYRHFLERYHWNKGRQWYPSRQRKKSTGIDKILPDCVPGNILVVFPIGIRNFPVFCKHRIDTGGNYRRKFCFAILFV